MVLVACFSGCGSPQKATDSDGADPSADSTAPVATSAPTSSPASDEPETFADPEDAQQAMRQVVRAMRTERVTAFEFELSTGGVVGQETEGVVSAEGWTSSTAFVSPDPDGPSHYTMRTIATAGTLWMQMAEWTDEAEGCWLTLEPGQTPLGVLAMLPEEPAYVSLLAYVQAIEFADETRSSIRAELAISRAMYLLTGKFVQLIDPDPTTPRKGRVPVLIGYDGRRITDLTLQGSDLAAALVDAGADPTDQARAALDATEITIEYPKSDAPRAVSAPAKEKQYSAGSRGCR